MNRMTLNQQFPTFCPSKAPLLEAIKSKAPVLNLIYFSCSYFFNLNYEQHFYIQLQCCKYFCTVLCLVCQRQHFDSVAFYPF